MSSEADKKEITISLSNYCVAFIDLLGQKELYKGVGDTPQISEKDSKILMTISSAIYGFQSDFDSALDIYKKSPRRGYEVLHKDHHELYTKMRTASIGTQRFSDGIVMFVKIANSKEHFPISSLFPMLGCIAIAFFGSLNRGFPFRGGIALGKGIELRPGEIYGPVVAKAYDLESKTAKYPRILVDEDVINYARSVIARQDDNAFESKFLKSMACQVIEAISEDADGELILDYLTFNAGLSQEPDPLKEQLSLGYKFIQDQIRHYQLKGDDTLLGRYGLMKSYWDSRAEILKPFGFVPVV